MCGIVGIFPLQSDRTEISLELQRAIAFWLHNEILYHTVKRGKDATGMVATFGPHEDQEKHPSSTFWACLKQPGDVDDFFYNDGTDKKYAGQHKLANIHALMDKLSTLDRPLKHLIGHTRARTVGSELEANNNHPIIVGNIIGVHNGGVKNHKKIYEKHSIKNIGDVDSEAIIQLFNEAAPDRALALDDIAYVTEKIEGPRAVMAFNNKHPEIVAFFRDTERPMEISFLEGIGLMAITSDRDFLKAALASYNRMRLLYGKHMPGSELLPQISETQGHIYADEGGLIDLNKPFDSSKTIKEWAGIKKFPDTLDDYKVVSTAPYKHVHSSSTGGGTIGFQSTASSEAKNVEADIEDISEYGPKKEDEEKTDSLVLVPSNQVMDDPEDLTAEATAQLSTTEEKVDTASEESGEPEDDEYGTGYLRSMAEADYFSENFLKDPRIVFNRLKGKLAKVVNVPGVTEAAAEALLQTVYPELFSDGFIYGHEHADLVAQAEDDEDEDESESVSAEALATENEVLKAELDEAKNRLVVATKHMANLKRFTLASLMVKDLISVDKDTGEVTFDDDIEAFLGMEKRFNSVNVYNVRKLFSPKEKRMISDGITAQSRAKTKTRSA